MEQVINYPSQLLPELFEAINLGYDKHFLQFANGSIKCLSNPKKYYDFDEVSIDDIVICSLIPATIYLIATLDGLYKGTVLEIYDIF